MNTERLKQLNKYNLISIFKSYSKMAFASKKPIDYQYFLELFNNIYKEQNQVPFDLSIEDVKLLERYNKNYYNRNTRLKLRIEKIIADFESPIFGTLTFTDKVLSSTSKDTRHQYVKKFLKAHCLLYVCNIDYGKEKGREHYHFVANNRLDPTLWRYGALNVKPIINKDALRLAKYVNKLTNHALKETASKGDRIIYSRGLGIKSGSHGVMSDIEIASLTNQIKNIFAFTCK